MSEGNEKPMNKEDLESLMGDISPLASQAGQLHELYVEQMRAGFTSIQSIYLIASILTGSPGPSPDDNESPSE